VSEGPGTGIPLSPYFFAPFRNEMPSVPQSLNLKSTTIQLCDLSPHAFSHSRCMKQNSALQKGLKQSQAPEPWPASHEPPPFLNCREEWWAVLGLAGRRQGQSLANSCCHTMSLLSSFDLLAWGC
jgi:hypothetical protein